MTSTRGMSTELIESMVNEYIVKLEAGAVEPDDQKIAAVLVAEYIRLLTNTRDAHSGMAKMTAGR